MTAPVQPTHATVVAQWRSGRGWRAVLLFGPPGAGKSDLALRLIARGWRLVSDDYAHVFASGGALYARAPETIEGRIEVRGVGVTPSCALGLARAVLAVELSDEPFERMPEPETRVLDGVSVPLLHLNPREASAGEKVAAAIARL
ncbi:HPr kinase/phosphorylase [Brevundimonas lenta]|uniref:Serine kinase of HPr protein (Carbohydrate metabolism regulator) n=1 Tax=Brevundimonas lenta TaxID=424796 RepID=A0A7W6JBL0_9CAUL|nr:HPr kinase/phosphatase C-terminal domain-containing protein [Brevundimonas lenta]MBB4081181.1 serine kinase of HPr protein (carbohydrate metabolism regulator) [Brevundimonas lenta]